MPDSTQATLVAARQKIENHKNWTQGNMRIVNTSFFGLVRKKRYCAVGAVLEVNGPYQSLAISALDQAAYDSYGYGGIITLNDASVLGRRSLESHKRVLEVYDLAIKKAK